MLVPTEATRLPWVSPSMVVAVVVGRPREPSPGQPVVMVVLVGVVAAVLRPTPALVLHPIALPETGMTEGSDPVAVEELALLVAVVALAMLALQAIARRNRAGPGDRAKPSRLQGPPFTTAAEVAVASTATRQPFPRVRQVPVA